jgi:hypothetical protein
MPEIGHVSARELSAEIKKCKSFDDIAIVIDGRSVTCREYLTARMVEYLRNYDDIELRNIAGEHTDCKLDTRELHTRLRHARQLLAQPIAKSTSYVCVTLSMFDFNFAYIYILIGDPTIVSYVSLGDSMKSYDGEWRGMITNMASYEHVISRYSEQIDKLAESYKITRKPKISIYHNVALRESALESIQNIVAESLLNQNLLVLTCFIGQYIDLGKDPAMVASPAMKKIANLGHAKSFEKVITQDDADNIYAILGSFIDPRGSQVHLPIAERSVRVGQKLIQMTPDDVSHPLSTSYQAWNEIDVARATLDLVLNMITPGFAIHSFWLTIFETSKFMYNTKDTRARIMQSQTIRLTPNDKRTEKILANEALCIVNEYCGPTFRHSLMSRELASRTSKFGSKYVFEMLYSLFCLHSLLGQFHGDFHCDNATIMQLLQRAEDPRRKVCYIIGHDKFVFQHDGSYGCVIDFSRTVRFDNPRWIEKVIEKYELYFGNDPMYTKLVAQGYPYDALDDDRALEKLKRKASAFDIYELAFTSRKQCRLALDGTDLGALLESIENESRHILLSDESKSDEPGQWADLILLKKYWQDDIVKEFSPADEYAGVYTYENPMLYSARSYESLPRAISRSPMARDRDDEPIDMHVNPSPAIKTRYKFYEDNIKDLLPFVSKK